MAPGGQRLSLGRASRIKSGRDFTRIKQRGERMVYGCLVANWHGGPGPGQAQTEPKARLAVITSRKVGGAVARNRARRLLREAFRLHRHSLTQPIDLVLVARPSISGKDFAGVEKDLLSVLRRAKLTTPGGSQ